MSHFEHIQGDTLTFKVIVKNSDGTLVNLTGVNAKFTMRKDYTKPIVLSHDCTVSNAAAGEIQVNVPASSMTMAPGAYKWEIQLTGAEVRTTPVQGITIISQLTPNV